MIEYVNVPYTKQEVKTITCDVCKKSFASSEWKETQEFVHIRTTGGYGSVFGDENLIELDICQCCLKQLLGAYIRINSHEKAGE